MWHEARRSERKVHDLMDAARKRAQRRALYLAKRRGDPRQSLQVVSTRSRIHRDDALYQAAQDLHGLIPWNGKPDVLIDRFDGRALLDFIRDPSSHPFRSLERSEEEDELEQFVNFERYRDLIKHRRRGFSDEEGIHHVNQEIEARIMAPIASERSHSSQTFTGKGSYSQVGFSYNDDGNDELQMESEEEEDDEEDDDEKDFSSDDSTDEGIEVIAKEFGVKKYNRLVYMDKKAKEEEKRRKEVIKGDPSIRKLSRKERRKASQIEREKEREAARVTGRSYLHDPYREPRRSPTYEAYPRSRRTRSRSRSRSPSCSRRHDRGTHYDDAHRSKSRTSKIEYITEFGGSNDLDDQKMEAISPPSSPQLQAVVSNRSGHLTFNICKARSTPFSLLQIVVVLLSMADSGFRVGECRIQGNLSGGIVLETSSSHIFEALHVDPASSASIELEKNIKAFKPSTSSGALSGMAKLNKAPNGSLLEPQQGEKKETPQERLKRIMSKQLNKQIKKDSAAEMAKKREQERLRLEKLAETSRLSRYRHRSRSRSDSRSPPRRYRHSRSRSRSPRRHHSRSRSLSRSPRSRGRSRY